LKNLGKPRQDHARLGDRVAAQMKIQHGTAEERSSSWNAATWSGSATNGGDSVSVIMAITTLHQHS
jgi:hypothetical protein